MLATSNKSLVNAHSPTSAALVTFNVTPSASSGIFYYSSKCRSSRQFPSFPPFAHTQKFESPKMTPSPSIPSIFFRVQLSEGQFWRHLRTMGDGGHKKDIIIIREESPAYFLAFPFPHPPLRPTCRRSSHPSTQPIAQKGQSGIFPPPPPPSPNVYNVHHHKMSICLRANFVHFLAQITFPSSSFAASSPTLILPFLVHFLSPFFLACGHFFIHPSFCLASKP